MSSSQADGLRVRLERMADRLNTTPSSQILTFNITSLRRLVIDLSIRIRNGQLDMAEKQMDHLEQYVLRHEIAKLAEAEAPVVRTAVLRHLMENRLDEAMACLFGETVNV